MDLIVEDTNILIDLYNTGLILHCHNMGYSFHTSKYVIEELGRDEQAKVVRVLIEKKLLAIDEFSGPDLLHLTLETYKYQESSNLTVTDCSVMLLAERHKCRLLTADQKLKRQAEERGLTVNGFLWICDQLVKRGKVPPSEMITHLDRYRDTNKSAPIELIDELKDELRKAIIKKEIKI